MFFDATGKRYALGDEKGNIRICRTSDDKELMALPGGGGAIGFGFLFSADGRFLAVSYRGVAMGFAVWDLSNARPVYRLLQPYSASLHT